MMQEQQEQANIDILDAVTMAAGTMIIATVLSAGGSLIVGLPVAVGYGIQHWVRRQAFFEHWVEGISIPRVNTAARQLLLPPPKDELTLDLRQSRPIDVNIVGDDRSLFQSLIKPEVSKNAETSVIQGVFDKNKQTDQKIRLNTAIKRLPAYIPYTVLPNPPTKMSVPIGFDSATKQLLWADFDKDTYHALVAGYTGSGKDALLRLWFSTLTANNTPEQLQFVVVDGKVDWLSPALAESAYMAIPPTGGMDIEISDDGKLTDCAKEKMQQSFIWIFKEIQKRQNDFARVGAVDLLSYEKKTGIKLPYLFFIASDVGETFDGNLKMLATLLIMKGRAYGVRLIISLQDPVGEGTKWRSQIGLVISGFQQMSDHDRYVLSVNVDQMLYRPSMLPNPLENPISKGLFVVRRGTSQHLVRTPHLPEEDWFQYIESVMQTKRDYKDSQNKSFLENILAQEFEDRTAPTRQMIAVPQQKVAPDAPKKPAVLVPLTSVQVNAIIRLTVEGKDKTTIMRQLKFTNGEKYEMYSATVDMLINKTKERIRNDN